MHTSEEQTEKIRKFLETKAPYSIIDKGITLAEENLVTECSKTASSIQGTITGEDGEQYSCNLKIISSSNLRATCTCSTQAEMDEQWCLHAVALLWQAESLAFLSESSGFNISDKSYRINSNSPGEIAKVVKDAAQNITKEIALTEYLPNVNIKLELSSDRMGIGISFDGEIQTPNLFQNNFRKSSRALDNLLIQIIDEEGSWDEEQNLWYVNSSRGIEIILGLLSEFKEITASNNSKPIHFSKEILEAQVTLEWQETSAELVLNWVFSDGKLLLKNQEIIGTGPYWVFLNNSIYKLSTSAAHLASIFPYSSTITLSKSQMGPILEVISDQTFEESLIKIINPKLQPKTEVATPKILIDFDLDLLEMGHFGSGGEVKVYADVQFEYPSSNLEKNLVYLRSEFAESNCFNKLVQLGFKYTDGSNRLFIEGDDALDFINSTYNEIPNEWQQEGLKKIRRQLKFSELSLDIDLTAGEETNGKIDWFDCKVALIQNNARLPLSLLFKREQRDFNRWVRLDNGSYARVPGGGLAHLKTSLGMLDPNFKLTNAIKTKLTIAQSIGLAGLIDEKINIKTDKRIKVMSQKLLSFEKIASSKEPKNFVGKLRHYQLDGLSWLKFLNEYNLDGILADEMGLGKTVQTLALIQNLKELTKPKDQKPALIIAPTSVITNWLYETRKFTPELNAVLLQGPKRKNLFSKIKSADIVITSYALLRHDRFDLEKYKFSYLILDEAQNIKNPQAATTKAAKALIADHRLALTGTPTENRPLELWSIMDFLMPGYLGSHDFFKKYIEKPILEVGTNVPAAKFLSSKTRPFILRRLKSQVEQELPPKIESIMYVPMHESQSRLYNQILDEVRPQIFEVIDRKGIRGASISILAALLRLRQVCNHPNSISAFKNMTGYESGKFDLLKELVSEAIDSGKKLLVFSQFREMLAIIRSWLDVEAVNYLYLDGATKDRQTLIDKFNSDENVRLFLISLKAGGTGLNLTAADTVIIYDPWWNPAVELQAVDRAHRIGQTKKVGVYRLVTENSIEQKIMKLKSKKAQIFDALINETGLANLNLTKADIESFFAPLDYQSS